MGWRAGIPAGYHAATIPPMVLVLPSYTATLPMPADLQRWPIWNAVFILVMINTGYVLFLVFIETEGVKHLRIQTELDRYRAATWEAIGKPKKARH
jgi:hypothetical protein